MRELRRITRGLGTNSAIRPELARRAAGFLTLVCRQGRAAQALAAALTAFPAAGSGRLIRAALASGPNPHLLARLSEHAFAGRLSVDGDIAVIQSLTRAGQLGDAARLAHNSLERAPHVVDLHIETANLMRAMNDLEGALRQLEAARELDPADRRILCELGAVEVRLGEYASAEEHLRSAVAAEPTNLKSHLDLARCILQQKRFGDAAALLRDATQAFPDRAEVYALLGHVLRWCGKHDEALAYLSRAVELAPNNSLAMVEMAQIREEIGEFQPALELHRRVVETRKNPAYNATLFCHALLAAGHGRDAWAANMKRVEYQALQTLPGVRLWTGEPLTGKSIMIINEGGTGDQIRDACTYADVIAAAGRVTVACEPRLVPLFQRSFPKAHFIPVKHEQRIADYERMLSKLIDDRALAEMKAHDFCVLSPDLLYYFRGDDRLWGQTRSYLVPAPDLLDRWRQRVAMLGPGFKVGISWRSGALYYNRECFYTRLSDWKPILTLPGVQFVNVQYDESEEEVRAAEEAFGIRIHRWGDLNLRDDFDGVSALLRQLDLVLAPNTTVLELAGALGVAGLYMIRVPIAYDHWRRKNGTGQDRLYPSVRQVRGDRPWDAESLIANTAAVIRQEVLEGRRVSGLG
jgi:tetratricopeptide (TPR) repeat protein